MKMKMNKRDGRGTPTDDKCYNVQGISVRLLSCVFLLPPGV